MRNFQIILVVIFMAAAVGGLLVFAGIVKIGKDSTPTASGTVTLWGTLQSAKINSLLDSFNQANQSLVVKYVEKNPESFNQDLLEALASGVGPDLFFLPDNLALSYANKIYPVSYQSFPAISFKNTFAGAGEVFLTAKRMLAFPMVIDPLVLYYNRSILDANNIVSPPVFWDDFVKLIPTLTKKDDTNKILQSATALGHFSNIRHAKDILAGLFMQTGDNIIAENNGSFYSVLGNSLNSGASGVLKFYTDFADPAKNVYAWNKSFSNSTDAFSNGNLAFYFGYASELNSLINKNPNQNFLVSSFPQIKNAKFKLTAGQVTGLAISAFSKNFNTAFTVASLMATGDFASKLSNAIAIPPARRDLLSVKLTDSFFPIFYSSALYAKSWLDPSPTDSNNIFRTMIESVLSNDLNPENAVKDASSKLNLLLLK